MTIKDLQEQLAHRLNSVEELIQGGCKAFAEDNRTVYDEAAEYVNGGGVAIVVVTPELARAGDRNDALGQRRRSPLADDRNRTRIDRFANANRSRSAEHLNGSLKDASNCLPSLFETTSSGDNSFSQLYLILPFAPRSFPNSRRPRALGSHLTQTTVNPLSSTPSPP